MPIRPRGSLVVFTNGVDSYDVYVNEATREYDILDFDRLEFSNVKLRQAPNAAGGRPVIVNNIAGIPIQFLYGCASDEPRPLVPDDANLASIKQRFKIIRWKIKTDIMDYAFMDFLDGYNQAHKIDIDNFHFTLEVISSNELSYGELIGLQSGVSFNSLTTTPLSMSGNCLGSAITPNNLLVRELSFGPEIEVTTAAGSNLMLRSADITLEQWTLSSRTFIS
jgi:hypothetical protein